MPAMPAFRQLLAASAIAATSLITSSVQADVLGLHVVAGQWQSDYSGSLGKTPADINELGYSNSDNNFFSIAFEHPIPLLPNLRLAHTDIDTRASGTISSDFQLTDNIYPAGSTIHSGIDLTQIDATLYYELLDNWVNLDLGLTVRKYDGEAAVYQENRLPEISQMDSYVPMIFGQVRFDLPLSGLYAGADVQYTSYKSDTIADAEINIGYLFDTPVVDFGLEVGYRVLDMDVDDIDDLNTNIKLDGPYAALKLSF